MGLLGVLAPSRCVACSLPGAPICPGCTRLLPLLRLTGCLRCGAPGPWPVARCVECAGRRLAFTRARGVLAYTGPTRVLVPRWKEHGRRDVTRRLVELTIEAIPPPRVDAVTFVPGDRERGRKRGFEPPKALANGIADRWDLPLERLLARTRSASSDRQAFLRGAERRTNVRGAFAPRAPSPPRVLLIDDVYTTGSTVSACATELRRAGARTVEVICLARAVR